MSNSRLPCWHDFNITKFKNMDDKHHQGLFCHMIPLGVRAVILASKEGWDIYLADRSGELGHSVKGVDKVLDYWARSVTRAFRQTVIMTNTFADDIAKFTDEGMAVEVVLHAASRQDEAALAGQLMDYGECPGPLPQVGAMTVLWAIPMSRWEMGKDNVDLGLRMLHTLAVVQQNGWSDPAVYPPVRLPALLHPNPWIPGYGIGRPGRDENAVMIQGVYATIEMRQATLVIDRGTRWSAAAKTIQTVTTAQATAWLARHQQEEL